MWKITLISHMYHSYAKLLMLMEIDLSTLSWQVGLDWKYIYLGATIIDDGN